MTISMNELIAGTMDLEPPYFHAFVSGACSACLVEDRKAIVEGRPVDPRRSSWISDKKRGDEEACRVRCSRCDRERYDIARHAFGECVQCLEIATLAATRGFTLFCLWAMRVG